MNAKETLDSRRDDHVRLHKALDQLVACWIKTSPKTNTRLPGEHSVLELMKWAFKQTENPECFRKRRH